MNFGARMKQCTNPSPKSKGQVTMRLAYVRQMIKYSTCPSSYLLAEKVKLEKQLEAMG